MNWKSKVTVAIIVSVGAFIALAIFSHPPLGRINGGIVISIGVGFMTYLFLEFVERIPTKRKRLKPRYAV